MRNQGSANVIWKICKESRKMNTISRLKYNVRNVLLHQHNHLNYSYLLSTHSHCSTIYTWTKFKKSLVLRFQSTAALILFVWVHFHSWHITWARSVHWETEWTNGPTNKHCGWMKKFGKSCMARSKRLFFGFKWQLGFWDT